MEKEFVEEITSNRKRRELKHDPRFGQEVKYNGLEPKHTAEPASAKEITDALDISDNDKAVAKEVLAKVEGKSGPRQEISKKTTSSEAKTKKKAQKATSKAKGKAAPAKSKEEKEKEAKRKKDLELSQERVKELNKCATFMLSCLEPGFREDWLQAAQEQRIPDIGMYVLGVLNRLSKMVDYMETDIEPEWDQGFVGYNEKLFCEYCKKEIEIGKTTHIRQRFCSNLCSKRYNEAHQTGIVYPTEKPGPPEAVLEEHKFMQEAKREGVVSVNG